MKRSYIAAALSHDHDNSGHPSSVITLMSSREPLWYCHQVCPFYFFKLTQLTHNQCRAEMRPLMVCYHLLALFPSLTTHLDARSALCIMQWYFRRESKLYTLTQIQSSPIVTRWRIQETIPVNTTKIYPVGSKMVHIHQGWTTFSVRTHLAYPFSVYSHAVQWVFTTC